MIKAIFFQKKNGFLKGFLISGHADFADYGRDIVCAGVSSAVFMCCNGILEIAKETAILNIRDGYISLKTRNSSYVVQVLLKALKLQLYALKEQYKKNIKFKVVEVF